MTLTKYLLFFATMNCAFAIYFIALYDAMHSNMMKYVLQNIVKRNLLLRKTHCKTSQNAMQYDENLYLDFTDTSPSLDYTRKEV